MEDMPKKPVIAPESNRFAMGLAATAAAAGVLLAPTSAHAAEESTDGHTAHVVQNEDPGYRFSPDLRTPDLDEGVFSPVVVHTTLPLQRHNMPFAPQFSGSGSALEVSPSDVSSVIGRLDSMTGMFMGDVKIEVQGSASAEDSHWLADAGIGEPSADNVELANERAKSFASELRNALHDTDSHRLKNADVTTKAGVEQVLDEDAVADLRKFAHEHGYSDINTMVVAFNEGHANHAAAERLSKLLVPQRGVRITISGDIPVVPALPGVKDAPKQEQSPEKKYGEITVEDKIAPSKEAMIKELLAQNPGMSLEDLLGLSGLAIATGVSRRRKPGYQPSVVPISVPRVPRHPSEFEIVSENNFTA